MSMNNKISGRLFYLFDSEMKPIETGVISLDDYSEIVYDVESTISSLEYFKGGEMAFKMSRKAYKQMKKVIQSVCPIYFTNNWRKMHHFPMVRRKKSK